MTQLPIELCITIMEHSCYTWDFTEDYETLSACSLVSPSWTDPAQKLLFRSVRILEPEKKTKFFDAIRPTDRGKILGSYVRKLDITLGYSRDLVQATSNCKQFALLLSWCPRLYELALLSFIHELDDTTIRELQHIAKTVKLRALHLMLSGVQSPILYQLISVWPGIQCLTIDFEIAASPPPQLPNIQLQELKLVRNPSLECLEWLFSIPQTSLKILDIRDVSGRQMVDVVAKYAPHLRSLRILCYNKDFANILRLCTQLEELVIIHMSCVIPLKDLPSTIEHFGFHDAGSSIHDSVLPLIAASPKLRVVTCHQRISENPDFPTLRSACEARNVELGMWS